VRPEEEDLLACPSQMGQLRRVEKWVFGKELEGEETGQLKYFR
jgi:hypothetical protein